MRLKLIALPLVLTLIAFSLLLPHSLLGGTPQDVTYYEIPMSPAEMTAEKLAGLRNIVLPTELAAADVVVWQSAAQWFEANSWGPLLTIPADPTKPTKMWSIRPGLQNPTTRYLRVARDPDGAVRRYSIRPASGGAPGGNPPETAVVAGNLTDQARLMTNVIGQSGLNFLAEWGGWFEAAGLPLLEWVDISPDEGSAVNFGGSGWTQLPLAAPGVDPYHVSTWPQGYMICFHPTTGRVVFFKVDEFISKVPKRAIGAAVSSSGTTYSATDAQVGQLAITLVTFSAGATADDIGRSINRLARATK